MIGYKMMDYVKLFFWMMLFLIVLIGGLVLNYWILTLPGWWILLFIPSMALTVIACSVVIVQATD